MACYILWRSILEPTGDEYPNLTAREFLSLHKFKCLDEYLCSFRSYSESVQLEGKYSHAKDWGNKFFFFFFNFWFELGIPANGPPIRACWSLVPNEDDFEVLLSPRKEARVQLVRNWVQDNPKLCFPDIILTPSNIERLLMGA